MTLHQIVSTAVFAGSVILLILTFIVPIFTGIRKRFIRIGTGFYVSGTALIFLISTLRPTIPPNFVWISEVFVFGIYAFTCGLVIFVTKNGPEDPGAGSPKHDNKEP